MITQRKLADANNRIQREQSKMLYKAKQLRTKLLMPFTCDSLYYKNILKTTEFYCSCSQNKQTKEII